MLEIAHKYLKNGTVRRWYREKTKQTTMMVNTKIATVAPAAEQGQQNHARIVSLSSVVLVVCTARYLAYYLGKESRERRGRSKKWPRRVYRHETTIATPREMLTRSTFIRGLEKRPLLEKCRIFPYAVRTLLHEYLYKHHEPHSLVWAVV